MYDAWSSYSKNKSPYGKICRRTVKIAPTFELSDGGTIHMFHLYNLPKETEWYCTFNKWTMYGAVGVNTNSYFVWAAEQISPKILNAMMEKQSTCFICMIYLGKHNGTVLLTYEAHKLYWAARAKKFLDETTTVTPLCWGLWCNYSELISAILLHKQVKALRLQ